MSSRSLCRIKPDQRQVEPEPERKSQRESQRISMRNLGLESKSQRELACQSQRNRDKEPDS